MKIIVLFFCFEYRRSLFIWLDLFILNFKLYNCCFDFGSWLGFCVFIIFFDLLVIFLNVIEGELLDSLSFIVFIVFFCMG